MTVPGVLHSIQTNQTNGNGEEKTDGKKMKKGRDRRTEGGKEGREEEGGRRRRKKEGQDWKGVAKPILHTSPGGVQAEEWNMAVHFNGRLSEPSEPGAPKLPMTGRPAGM